MNKKNGRDLSITLKIGQKIQVGIFQGKHTVGQKAHEKMLSITNYQRNVSQNYNVISPNTDQNGHHQKVYRQSWRGCGEKGTLLHCCWECKLIQPLWRTGWRFLKKTRNRATI